MVDVSGSMYRFNGHDKRLERMLQVRHFLATFPPSLARPSCLYPCKPAMSLGSLLLPRRTCS